MTPNSPPPTGKGERRGGSCSSSRASTALTVLSITAFALTVSHAPPAEAHGHGHGHHGHGSEPDGPFGTGNLAKGELAVTLQRGAAVPFEITVIPTPNECQGHLDLSIEWDQAEDEVVVSLEGEGALEPYPDVDRTLGVNYLPNPAFVEPEDYTDGRYQLWIVGAAGPVTLFFYDPATLDLMGSIYDFEVPPPAIPVFFPTLRLFATDVFQPDASGDVDQSWTFAYSGLTRLDRPEFSHHLVTFPPTNLCGANPNRLDLSTLRPYITPPFPADAAMTWSDYLRGGLLFDVTVEPGSYYTEPPTTTLVATYSGATAVPGGIPRGWTFDIDAAFMGVAPPIRPWAGAGACVATYAPVHTTGLDVCGGAP